MPSKRKGFHNIHLKVREEYFRTLQEYCTGGIERISATQILELFLDHYIQDYIRPRMAKGEIANWVALKHDLPRTTALIAHKIEPTAFEAPTNE